MSTTQKKRTLQQANKDAHLQSPKLEKELKAERKAVEHLKAQQLDATQKIIENAEKATRLGELATHYRSAVKKMEALLEEKAVEDEKKREETKEKFAKYVEDVTRKFDDQDVEVGKMSEENQALEVEVKELEENLEADKNAFLGSQEEVLKELEELQVQSKEAEVASLNTQIRHMAAAQELSQLKATRASLAAQVESMFEKGPEMQKALESSGNAFDSIEKEQGQIRDHIQALNDLSQSFKDETKKYEKSKVEADKKAKQLKLTTNQLNTKASKLESECRKAGISAPKRESATVK